jgi:hypothetical protein
MVDDMTKRTADKLLKQGYSFDFIKECLTLKNKRRGEILNHHNW